MGWFRPPKTSRGAIEALMKLPAERQLEVVEFLWWCERVPREVAVSAIRELAPLLEDEIVDRERLTVHLRGAISGLRHASERRSAGDNVT